MGIRLETHNTSGVGPLDSGRPEQAGLGNNAFSVADANVTAAQSTDQVSLSSFANIIANANDAAAAQRSAQLSQIAGQYSSGNYQVDSGLLSRSIVSDALISGQVEKDS